MAIVTAFITKIKFHRILKDTFFQVPIQITLPPQPGSDGSQRILTIQVPGSALQGNQLQKVLTGPVITATMGLPANIASSLLQQHVNAAFNSQQQAATVAIVNKHVIQTDGAADQEGESSQQNELINERIRTDKELEEIIQEGISIEIIMPRNRKKAKSELFYFIILFNS